MIKDALKTDVDLVRGHLNELVRSTVEDTLNKLLDAEAEQLCNAKCYARSAVPSRCKRRESSVEEALVEMHLAGVSMRRVEEKLSYMRFPSERWILLWSNNTLERVMKEIRRRTRVVADTWRGPMPLVRGAAKIH
jgi:transposase-like protein